MSEKQDRPIAQTAVHPVVVASPSQPPTTSCRLCRSDMPADAAFCLHCKSYQGRLQGAVAYIAQNAALLGLAASAIVFTSTQVSAWYRDTHWKAGAVIAKFDSSRGITILNASALPLYVAAIQVSTQPNGSERRRSTYALINKVVKPGEIVEHELLLSFSGGMPPRSLERGERYATLPVADPDEKRKLLAMLGQTNCVDIAFHTLGDSQLSHYATHFQRSLETVPGTLRVYVTSGTGESLIVTSELAGVWMLKQSPECPQTRASPSAP